MTALSETAIDTAPVVPVCIDCGATTTPSGITTGYGTTPAGEIVCFACCGVRDRAELAALPVGGRTMLYLSVKKTTRPMHPDWKQRTHGYDHTVTNWPGTLSIKPTGYSYGSHNWANTRIDVWFTLDGAHFHGVCYGNNTQILHVRKIKPLAH